MHLTTSEVVKCTDFGREAAGGGAPAWQPVGMDLVEQLLADNQRWVDAGWVGPGPARPSRAFALLTCMDVRIDPAAAFGLALGQAHVLRNAGGLVTDDVLRSLAISQRKLGTGDVVIVQHTECGLLHFDDDDFRAGLAAVSGAQPPWSVPGFDDLDQSVRQQVEAVAACPWLVSGQVLGLAFDVSTGRLRLVETTGAPSA